MALSCWTFSYLNLTSPYALAPDALDKLLKVSDKAKVDINGSALCLSNRTFFLCILYAFFIPRLSIDVKNFTGCLMEL